MRKRRATERHSRVAVRVATVLRGDRQVRRRGAEAAVVAVPRRLECWEEKRWDSGWQ
jgi:hypothetical protein